MGGGISKVRDAKNIRDEHFANNYQPTIKCLRRIKRVPTQYQP